MSAAINRRVLVPIGNGSEEIETASVVDTLRRAGANVTLASVETTETVCMSRGMKFQADSSISAAQGSYDAIALPGGMPGAERLRDSTVLTGMLREAKKAGRIIAAVCAAPAVVLAEHGLLEGVEATCYPAEGFRGKVKNIGKGDVVVSDDGKLITATGPGSVLKWSLMLVEVLYSKELADKIASEMLVSRG